jgi:hypothetical protein
MGTIKQGILGGFSGKVGTVIGGSWKGISYMRSQAQSIKNPRTEAQMSQRTKFALALSFLKPMTELLRTGFKLYANKKTAFNSAMSYTLANAISGDYPDYELQFANALVSRGALTVATNGTATSSSGNVVISWDDNSGVGTAKATDKTLIAILNADRGEAVTVSAGEARVTGTQTLAVPADWLGENVHVYLGFVSEDFKEVANSVYLGSVTIA